MPDRGFLGHDLVVWFATLVGVALHILKPQHPSAPKVSLAELWRARAFATLAGFAVGIWGYAPVVEWRGLDGDTWNVPIALFLATVGGSVARIIIEFDYAKLIEIFKIVRGQSSYEPPITPTRLPHDLDDPESDDDENKN